MRVPWLTLASLAILVCAADGRSSASLTVHPLDETDLASPLPWTFLPAALHGVDVVSLPEPIHMTHEFPLVRLGIVEFLNEHMGFHVLAMEGSLVDAWAAQDRFLASGQSDADAADAQLALFPLWNTPEIQRLFRYETASWSTPAPLYITAYDVQPGTGKGTPGSAAFRLLADRLATYAPPPDGLVVDNWVRDLRPLTEMCRAFTREKQAAADAAIVRVESWIARADRAVATRHPRVPMHAAALALLPANLRGSLALCNDVTSTSSGKYKAVRDREGAIFAEALRRESPGAKLMLWAHWSHLTVDPAAGVSVGVSLRQKLGDRLYTVLPVAERGTAIVIFPNPGSDEDIGLGWVRRGSDEFSTRMRALSPASFFLDLRDPALKTNEAFAGEQAVWVESRAVRVHLLDAADALVWVKHVGPPELPLPVLVILGGMHYRLPLAAGAAMFVTVAVSLLVSRRRRTGRSA